MRAEIGVIGGGFAGSLAAILLRQAGRRVVLLDPSLHPRFRVGESSTPTADLLLRQLAERYDVPELDALTRYGSWRRRYPNMRCGCKRGFSYFHHREGERFQSNEERDNELLVAASTSDDIADTHWLRADIDLFLLRMAQKRLEAREGVRFKAVEQTEAGWQVEVECGGENEKFEFDYLIDGSGAAGVIADAVGVEDQGRQLRTRTGAIYTHCENVGSWSQRMEQSLSGCTSIHPFDADLAAQHHVIDDGWVWMLRFDGNLTSVGLVRRAAELQHVTTAEMARAEIRNCLSRYPSLAELLEGSWLADAPGKWLWTNRMQRSAKLASGDNWAMLPATAGIVDPLHSTGIAHTVSGVARLVELLGKHWKKTSLAAASRMYGSTILEEVRHIDRLVSVCYAALPSFSKFVDCSMLYFLAAIGFERRCLDALRFEQLGGFLGADDEDLVQLLSEAERRLARPEETDHSFRAWLQPEIGKRQTAGLMNPSLKNMYDHTAAE